MKETDDYRGHPIGPQYTLHSRGSDSPKFVNPESLDQRIRLFGQGVGCGSCHSVYAKQEQLLVLSNTKSRLCLSCHSE